MPGLADHGEQLSSETSEKKALLLGLNRRGSQHVGGTADILHVRYLHYNS